ncbi:MAG: cytochrome c biogenesis protein CcdA [bacterium]|nr:cytochrome c biogenesis protein CcdA [bacterium]
MEGLLFQTSLIAAFVAGMVALFAPCCISFLLPAYLGSIFKEKEKVLLMTLVFGLGIFVVLLPAVLGVAFISQFLFRNHDALYTLSAVIMLTVAVVTFFGLKLPMPRLPGVKAGKTDVFSIFILGIFSGITSACCAPVLIGILAMTFLSPSFFGALAVGAMYVFGMVFPLLLISIFLSGKVPSVGFLRKNLATFNFFGKKYYLIASNLAASMIFFITGWAILILTLSGKLGMGNMGVTKAIQDAGNLVNSYVGGSLIVNVLFLLGVGGLLYWVSKKL